MVMSKLSLGKYLLGFTVVALLGAVLASKFVFTKDIKVIQINSNINSYIDLAKEGNSSKKEGYQTLIKSKYNSIVDEIVNKEDNKLAKYALFEHAFENPSVLKMQLDLMNDFEIEKVILTTYRECSKKAQNSNLNVIILPTSEYTSGFTPSSNLIVLYVNCLGSKETVIDTIKWTFAHEYAHSCDTGYAKALKNESPLYSDTILKDMVFEGKANNFADLMYGDKGFRMDRNYCSNSWEFYRNKLNTKGYEVVDFQSSMIGNETFLRYDIYVYGTALVKSYLEIHKELTVNEWLKQPPSAYESAVESMK